MFRSRNVHFERTNVPYSLVEITKIMLTARGPICDALPEEAVNKAFLLRQMPKLKKLEWRHTGSPKRWVSVLRNHGELLVKKREEGDRGELMTVRRVYYTKPGKRMIISSLEGNYIKIVHFKLDSSITNCEYFGWV